MRTPLTTNTYSPSQNQSLVLSPSSSSSSFFLLIEANTSLLDANTWHMVTPPPHHSRLAHVWVGQFQFFIAGTSEMPRIERPFAQRSRETRFPRTVAAGCSLQRQSPRGLSLRDTKLRPAGIIRLLLQQSGVQVGSSSPFHPPNPARCCLSNANRNQDHALRHPRLRVDANSIALCRFWMTRFNVEADIVPRIPGFVELISMWSSKKLLS
jgi:hypothetical protein